MAGAIDGEECLAVGTYTSGDTSQIWLGRVDKQNMPKVEKQITSGSSNEKAFALAVSGNSTYIGVKVNNELRVFVTDQDGNLINPGASQKLGPGSIFRIKPIKINSDTYILMLGARAGSGMLWLFSPDGYFHASQAISSVEAFTDAIQLGDGSLLVSGWKSAASGTGTVGIVEHISTNLALIE